MKVFIIHGWDGSPDKDWIPWLKNELEDRNFEVIAFEMPDSAEPKIEKWVPFLEKEVNSADEKTFFVGHSIGCQTILRYLEKEKEKIGGAVFVAPWVNLKGLEDENSERIAKPWIETPINWDKITVYNKKFIAIFSDNDPFVPLSDTEIFKEKLNAEIIIEHGKGHFSQDNGITKLPSVLDSILKLSGIEE